MLPRLLRPQFFFETSINSVSQSLGFNDHVLESSHGKPGGILVSYCPSKSLELKEKVTTKHSESLVVTDGLKCAVLKQDPDQAFLGRAVKEEQKHSQTYANMLCNALF